MEFVRPPIHEVGLSVSLAEPSAFDSYDIRAVHDQFRAEFPEVERVQPCPGGDLEVAMGFPALNAETVTRWWLKSADQANVLQLQENFIARNWRRTASALERPNYPGYNVLSASFHEAISVLQRLKADAGGELPDIRACELTYDDVIVIPEVDGVVRASNVLTYLREDNKKGRLAGNWQNAWFEPFWPGDLGVEAMMSANISLFFSPVAGQEAAPLPIVRTILKVSTGALPWEKLPTFFDEAHAYISGRFDELITDQAKESWTRS